MTYEEASKKIRQCPTTNEGASGAEKNYALAYQAEVRDGVKPQIKRKYRYR